jgi:DNA-directed RNA polymerase II subunit RPB1
MPPLSLKYKTHRFGDKDENKYKTTNSVLEIENGKYIRGQIEKGVLGDGSKGLIQRICNDFGNMASADFIDDFQNIITEYMKSSAYSVGISDLIANKATYTQILTVIAKQKAEVQELINRVHLGVFENNTARSNMSEFETSVNNILNKATEEAGTIGRGSLDPNNRFLIIVNSGSSISYSLTATDIVGVNGLISSLTRAGSSATGTLSAASESNGIISVTINS